VPVIGAYSFVFASPSSALCTLAFALSTEASAEGMLPAEEVVLVDPPPLDPLPPDPLPLDRLPLDPLAVVCGVVVVVFGVVVVVVGVVVVVVGGVLVDVVLVVVFVRFVW
jgi:hypothetical protein